MAKAGKVKAVVYEAKRCGLLYQIDRREIKMHHRLKSSLINALLVAHYTLLL